MYLHMYEAEIVLKWADPQATSMLGVGAERAVAGGEVGCCAEQQTMQCIGSH